MRIQTPMQDLSGGWRMRCMLANVLLQDADIMLLDEPTNFLDLLGIMWLQSYLLGLRSSSSKTIVVVSHDRAFMDQVCEEIILLKDQTLVYFDGNLTAYEEDLEFRRLNLERMQESQNRQIAHMKETIADNIKAGKKHGDDNRLRQAVSRQKKIEDRSGMQVNARGGRFKLSRDRAGIIYPSDEFGLGVPHADTDQGGMIRSGQQSIFHPRRNPSVWCFRSRPIYDFLDLLYRLTRSTLRSRPNKNQYYATSI